jgi:hypothetical protein
MGSVAGRPQAFETIVYGGLAVGVLDFLDASIFFPLYYGITVQRVWHGVAAGLLGGEAARAGGWGSASLGIFLHFAVAFCIAAVYFLLSRNISFLIRHPILSGLIYGIAAHFVMQFVVIPLSAIGWRSTPFDVGAFLNSIIGHALLVGPPVALIAAWSARRREFA